MWFYALLGNNQARDPWLDESFATYAQARAAGQLDSYRLNDVDAGVRGELGRPMTYWADRGGFGRYVRGVYDQGAAALIEGRRRVGEEPFDQAMRAYIDTYAHHVVEPADVRRRSQMCRRWWICCGRREDCRGRADALHRPSSCLT